MPKKQSAKPARAPNRPPPGWALPSLEAAALGRYTPDPAPRVEPPAYTRSKSDTPPLTWGDVPFKYGVDRTYR